ncbi:hypothetical protein VNO78_23488 [Psophocarpus tetragonolobus]|uniref:Uncharacterized protein n=1 Tax=Psophocarpus tetragonolobus TaxID=3891 RepID=A0AAN9XE20_PSOTE
MEVGSGMLEAYIKTEKGVWLCAAVVKSGRDMREWGRPIGRQCYAKGCFHHIKGLFTGLRVQNCSCWLKGCVYEYAGIGAIM